MPASTSTRTVFVNYGFVTSAVQALMHPRGGAASWHARHLTGRSVRCWTSCRARGAVHPREVDEHFSHGTVTNYWGGSSSATTHLLDCMHYRGLLRVVRREAGIRIYAAHEHPTVLRDARHPSRTRRRARRRGRRESLRAAAGREPVDARETAALRRSAVAARARDVLFSGRGSGWRTRASTASTGIGRQKDSPERVRCPADSVRLLAPFDPVVWDRRRFELLWGWAYRFEAYTPAPKRKLGYYALPLLWRDRVIGWGNVAVKDGRLQVDFGYTASQPPAGRIFRRERDAELDRFRAFLRLDER